MPMESICETFTIAAERWISWNDVKDIDHDEAYRLPYFDKRVRESVLEKLNWDYVHKELTRTAVNLRLLHGEGKDVCRQAGKVLCGCAKFRNDRGRQISSNDLTERIEHEAGGSCEIDQSRPMLKKGLANPITGKASKIYLLFGVPPFNQKAHIELALNMKEQTWLRCRIHMCDC